MEQKEHAPDLSEEQNPEEISEAQSPEQESDSSSRLFEERVASLEAALVQLQDEKLRALAEVENMRRRALREREDATKYAIAGFARDLLDVADNLARALEHVPAGLREESESIANVLTGVESTQKELQKVFKTHGIEKLSPTSGVFDPNYHEAMFEVPAAGIPSGTVVQLVEDGYVLNGRLLRPARVGVSKATGGEEPIRTVDTEA